MNEVYHTTYGQGNVVQEDAGQLSVKFADGVTRTVAKGAVSQVIND